MRNKRSWPAWYPMHGAQCRQPRLSGILGLRGTRAVGPSKVIRGAGTWVVWEYQNCRGGVLILGMFILCISGV